MTENVTTLNFQRNCVRKYNIVAANIARSFGKSGLYSKKIINAFKINVRTEM
jgi:hypothetical protein